jgi:hypothetical protein
VLLVLAVVDIGWLAAAEVAVPLVVLVLVLVVRVLLLILVVHLLVVVMVIQQVPHPQHPMVRLLPVAAVVVDSSEPIRNLVLEMAVLVLFYLLTQLDHFRKFIYNLEKLSV